jgi:hypothetical protein
MHNSLTPRSNLVLILVWGAIVGASIFSSMHPNRTILIGIGAAFGLVAGAFQLRALHETQERFLSATTAIEVRAAMMSSRSGRLATYTIYAVAGVLLLTAFAQNEVIGFGLVTGYASFAFVRECLTLRGCIALQRAQSNQNEEG